jgi:spermidine synthase
VAVARIIRQEGRRALAVDGVVQSIEVVPDEPTPGYWPEMLPARPPASALLLGYGGGTVARLLLDAYPEIAIVAVDDDESILELGRRNLRFRVDDPRLRLEVADAFAHARELAVRGERFDLVAVDLYRAGEMERAVIARPFLKRVESLLTDEGTAAFNLMRDRRTARRLRRIGQHLRITETRLVGLNCVVHCRSFDS